MLKLITEPYFYVRSTNEELFDQVGVGTLAHELVYEATHVRPSVSVRNVEKGDPCIAEAQYEHLTDEYRIPYVDLTHETRNMSQHFPDQSGYVDLIKTDNTAVGHWLYAAGQEKETEIELAMRDNRRQLQDLI